MKTALIALFLMVLSVSASASTLFTGKVKGSNSVCELEIIQSYYENNTEKPENLRVEVAVSLSEGDHTDSDHKMMFTVSPGARANIFSGVGVNSKDLINVSAASGSVGLVAPTAFSVKWLHGSHYHTAQCLGLALSTHE
jgi:hypothetical protein